MQVNKVLVDQQVLLVDTNCNKETYIHYLTI